MIFSKNPIVVGLINIVIIVRDIPWFVWLLILVATYPAVAQMIYAAALGFPYLEEFVLIVLAIGGGVVTWKLTRYVPYFRDTKKLDGAERFFRHMAAFCIVMTGLVIVQKTIEHFFVEHRMKRLSVTDREHVRRISLQLARAEPEQMVVFKSGLTEVILYHYDAWSGPDMASQCRNYLRTSHYFVGQDATPSNLMMVRTALTIEKIVPKWDSSYQRYASQCESYDSLWRHIERKRHPQ